MRTTTENSFAGTMVTRHPPPASTAVKPAKSCSRLTTSPDPCVLTRPNKQPPTGTSAASTSSRRVGRIGNSPSPSKSVSRRWSTVHRDDRNVPEVPWPSRGGTKTNLRNPIAASSTAAAGGTRQPSVFAISPRTRAVSVPAQRSVEPPAADDRGMTGGISASRPESCARRSCEPISTATLTDWRPSDWGDFSGTLASFNAASEAA